MLRRISILVISLASFAICGQFDMKECDKTKTCLFRDPSCKESGERCALAISYRMPEAGLIEWEMLGTVPSATHSYISVGLSADNKMGDDFVTECSWIGNESGFTAKLSFNKYAFPNKTRPFNSRIHGEEQVRSRLIKEWNSSYEDGSLYCRVLQVVDGSANADEISEMIYRWSTDGMYVLGAVGQTNEEGLLIHDNDGAHLWEKPSEFKFNGVPGLCTRMAVAVALPLLFKLLL